MNERPTFQSPSKIEGLKALWLAGDVNMHLKAGELGV
jgi:hypothetical protein